MKATFNYTVKADFKTKIYICVETVLYDSSTILGVFLNKKDAENYMKKEGKVDSAGVFYDIEEWLEGETY